MNMIAKLSVFEVLTEIGVKPESARTVERELEAAFQTNNDIVLNVIREQTMPKAEVVHLATKTDLADLRTELKTEIGDLRTELKTEIGHLRTELKADLANLRTELKTDMADLRTELKTDMADLRTDLQRWFIATQIAIAALIIAAIKLL